MKTYISKTEQVLMKKWPLLVTLMLAPLPAFAQIPANANTTIPGHHNPKTGMRW